MCDHENGFDGFDWENIDLIGTLSEELAEAERERQWLLKQVQPEKNEEPDSDE